MLTPVYGVREVSYTAGTYDYVLSGAVAGSYRFNDRVQDGSTNLLVTVSDSARVEWSRATFIAPNTLKPTEIISSSNNNNKVSWPATGQRVVTLVSADAIAMLPVGGVTGDQLRKRTNADYDTRWEGSPYPIAMFLPGELIGGAAEDRSRATILVTEAVTFLANFAGSYFFARVAATAETVLGINEITGPATAVAIGTVTFAAASSTGVLASTGGTAKALIAGQSIELLGPATADDTLADIRGTLRGRRS